MPDPLDIFGAGSDPLDLFGASEDPLDTFGSILTPEERLRRMRERFPGAMPGLSIGEEEERPGYGKSWLGKVGRTITSGAAGLADLATRSRMMPSSGPLKGLAEREAAKDAAARDRLAEASVGAPTIPRRVAGPIAAATRIPREIVENPLSTLGFWGAEVTGMTLDPLEALPGGMLAAGGRRAAGALRRGGRAVREVAEEVAERAPRIASHAGQGGESPEAIARVARGERYYRVSPGGEVTPIPNTVDAVDMRVNPGEAKVRVTAQGTVEVEQGGRATRAQGEAISKLREGSGAPSAREAVEREPGEYFLDLDADEPTIMPIGKEGKLRPPDEPYQYNASSLDVPETALPEIRETMRAEKTLTRRRTGVGIDYDDPKRLRAEVGMAEEDFLKAPAGSIWNREQHALLDAYVGKWGRRVEELRPKVVSGKASESELEAFADARVKWIDLLATSMAGRTEVGRALESYKHLRTALDSPESLRTHLARKMGKSHGGKLTDEELDLLSKADLDNPDEITALLVKANKPKWWGYPRELFYSAILSGLGTHGRNVVGNAFHAASQVPVRIVGALLDAPLAKLSGRQRERYMREVVPSLVGLGEGFQDGMIRFAEAFRRHGLPTSKFDVPRSAFRRAPSKFVRERVAPVVDMPFRLLAAADELFKGINRGAHLRALAVRSGVQKGLKGDDLVDHVARFMADPPKEALEQAVRFEQKMTFTNPLGPTAKHLEKLKNSSPVLGYLVPFVRTPVNLFKRGIEFTPANLPRAVMMGVKGAPEAADELAKVATGSAMMGLAGMKAAAGELTGPPPTDRAERDAFYQQGKQPFSVKFGDRWFSFSQIEPLAMPLALVASAAEGARRGEADATNFERMQKGMALLLANQLDRSYLSGLADVADLITYGASSEEVFTGFAGRQASALGVPFSGMMRTVANAIDPRIVEKRSFGDYFRANIPGMKQDLPARLTRFGEEITRTRWQAVGPTGTPLVPTKEADDTIEAALRELQVNVGFPGESIEGVKLEDDEYREYLKRVGPQTKAVLEYLVTDESFQQIPPDMRQRIVDSFVQSTRDTVRTEAILGLVPGIPPLLVKKALGSQVDAFNSERSRVDGISSRYNERTRNRGQTSVEEMFEAGEEADQAWSVAYAGLQQAVTDARRQGLAEEQIVGLLRKKGLSHRVAQAVVGGATMSFQDYRNRRGDFQ